MGYKSDDRHRNDEIVSMYFSVVKSSLSKGKSMREAKNDAYDAITLRFYVSEKTARMLISERIREDYAKYNGTFYTQNEAMIEMLEDSNRQMKKEIERNNTLIKLLKEVNEDYGGKKK